MTEIKPGDIVRLKSGGPNMTADEINYTNNHRFCYYFNNNKQLVTVQIKEELLLVVNNKTKYTTCLLCEGAGVLVVKNGNHQPNSVVKCNECIGVGKVKIDS